MEIGNPFEMIMSRLEQLQVTVNRLIEQQPAVISTAPYLPGAMLDLVQAAEVLRKPVGTVRYYIHHRDLPAQKVGKSYLVEYGKLVTWLSGFGTNDQAMVLPIDKMREVRTRYRKR